MCGLAAYFTNKQKNIKLAQAKFKWLLWYSQRRGTEATGAGTIAKRGSTYNLFLAKTNKPATAFIRSKGFKELMGLNSLMAIGHTRSPTQGTPLNNKNNHPIYTKSGLAIVHNGQILNDEDLAKEHKIKPDGLCDTELYLKLIDKCYKKKKGMIKAIQEATEEISGTIACLILNKKEPRTLYAVSVNNPICLAYHIPTGIIYIASEEEILQDSLLDFRLYYGFFEKKKDAHDYIFTTLDEEIGIRITPYGISSFPVETSTSYYSARGSQGGSYQGKSLIQEEDDEDFLDRTFKEAEDNFDVTEPIKRPSLHLSNLLVYRVRQIAEELQYPQYLEEEEYHELIKERDRILDTLVARNYFTKIQAEGWREGEPYNPKFKSKKKFKSARFKKISVNKDGQVELIESGN